MMKNFIRLFILLSLSLFLYSPNDFPTISRVETSYYKKPSNEPKEIHYSNSHVKSSSEASFSQANSAALSLLWKSVQFFEQPIIQSLLLIKSDLSDSFLRLNILSSKNHPPTHE